TDFNGQFEHQIAFNLLPKIGSFLDNEYSTEEMKMENEGRKIMHLPDLKVTCTCVRVPVLRSHSISVSVSTEKELSVEEVKEAMRRSKDVVYKEFPDYPMPLDSTDNDLTYVGRIRKDRVLENGISLFCSGDQIRKGAATNAVQIMEYIEEHGKH
ncbi:MAG: aspartate-semialdehyde dehydrogenase, partial [Solobacterium sp.]|nr:aspartate-semialdehyde dehydrogenase [Solobacterium sp.]